MMIPQKHSISPLLFALTTLLPLLSAAQQAQVWEQQVPTEVGTTHLDLQLHVPSGELVLRESGECGKAHARVVAPDSNSQWMFHRQLASNGTCRQEAVVHHAGIAAAPPALDQRANLRHAYRLDPMASDREAHALRSEYRLDPTLSTDLRLHLGRGSSWLDLSAMSLRSVMIETAFSDVVVTYSKPNQVTMQKMHIHAANANLILKHLELANARLIQVQNDMGTTKLMLGMTEAVVEDPPIIELRNGVGDCLVVVDRDHPVKIVVKTGVLASANIENDFEKHADAGDNTYLNAAARRNPDQPLTTILCDLDFGTLTLVSR